MHCSPHFPETHGPVHTHTLPELPFNDIGKQLCSTELPSHKITQVASARVLPNSRAPWPQWTWHLKSLWLAWSDPDPPHTARSLPSPPGLTFFIWLCPFTPFLGTWSVSSLPPSLGLSHHSSSSWHHSFLLSPKHALPLAQMSLTSSYPRAAAASCPLPGVQRTGTRVSVPSGENMSLPFHYVFPAKEGDQQHSPFPETVFQIDEPEEASWLRKMIFAPRPHKVI